MLLLCVVFVFVASFVDDDLIIFAVDVVVAIIILVLSILLLLFVDLNEFGKEDERLSSALSSAILSKCVGSQLLQSDSL